MVLWKFVEDRRVGGSACRIYSASDPDDLRAVYEIWTAVYGDELGWLSPETRPMYEDPYHDHSSYLVARVDDKIVGTMRLVADSPIGLPIEQFADIDDLKAGRTVIECQRLMILREYRNKRYDGIPFGIFSGFAKACIHWCIVNGVTHIIADVFESTATTPISPLLALGFEDTGRSFIDTELREPSKSMALIGQVGELFSRQYRTTSAFYRYLSEPDPAIDVYLRELNDSTASISTVKGRYEG